MKTREELKKEFYDKLNNDSVDNTIEGEFYEEYNQLDGEKIFRFIESNYVSKDEVKECLERALGQGDVTDRRGLDRIMDHIKDKSKYLNSDK